MKMNMIQHMNIQEAETKLRICCYGSSSSKTLQKYINDAYKLGYILKKRGHTCVNGAGETGCMGAMNRGVEESDGPGKVVGVIHKMFLRGGDDNDNGGDDNGKKCSWFEGCAPVFKNCESSSEASAELIVVGGDSLQERKRKLVENIDALIVMPGGPGTFDEVGTCNFCNWLMKLTRLAIQGRQIFLNCCMLHAMLHATRQHIIQSFFSTILNTFFSSYTYMNLRIALGDGLCKTNWAY